MKKIFSGIKDGLLDFRAAHRLVVSHRLWRLVLIPGVLSVLYFPVVLVGMFFVATELGTTAIDSLFPRLAETPLVYGLVVVVLYVVAVILGFLTFRNVIMVLCSPLLGRMSEAIEKEMGRVIPPEFCWRGCAYDAMRGTLLSGITLAIAIVIFVGCWFISLVPIIGALTSFVLMPLSQAFLAGVGFADPALERRRYSVGRSLQFSWANRSRLVGHGIGFSLLLLIPVVGWFLAPSYGIIAGTIGAVAALDVIDTEGIVDIEGDDSEKEPDVGQVIGVSRGRR